MEIKNAKLTKICDAKEGVNKSGNPWRKVTAVFETSDHYPKTIAVTCFNSLCEEITNYTPGAQLNVTLDVESRSWTSPEGVERWFTEATARMIVPSVATGNVGPGGHDFDTPLPPLNEPKPKTKNKKDDENNDLPF